LFPETWHFTPLVGVTSCGRLLGNLPPTGRSKDREMFSFLAEGNPGISSKGEEEILSVASLSPDHEMY